MSSNENKMLEDVPVKSVCNAVLDYSYKMRSLTNNFSFQSSVIVLTAQVKNWGS
jgi:hypothetical protein